MACGFTDRFFDKCHFNKTNYIFVSKFLATTTKRRKKEKKKKKNLQLGRRKFCVNKYSRHCTSITNDCEWSAGRKSASTARQSFTAAFFCVRYLSASTMNDVVCCVCAQIVCVFFFFFFFHLFLYHYSLRIWVSFYTTFLQCKQCRFAFDAAVRCICARASVHSLTLCANSIYLLNEAKK